MKSRTEPVKLEFLDIKRLKAYRKSLYKKIGPYEICWCGCAGCDYEIDRSRKDPLYIFYKSELERVNIELGRRQWEEYKRTHANEWANISITSVETKREERKEKVLKKRQRLWRRGYERAVRQQEEGMAKRRREHEEKRWGIRV